MLMFRDEVHLDPCYLPVVLERSKTVAKGLCSRIQKRFFGAGRAGSGPEMLMFRDEVHLDTCYLLVVLERSKRSLKGSAHISKSGFLALAARRLHPGY